MTLLKNYYSIYSTIHNDIKDLIKSGNYDLFSSTYDITYLNMAMPFIICMICLSNKKE